FQVLGAEGDTPRGVERGAGDRRADGDRLAALRDEPERVVRVEGEDLTLRGRAAPVAGAVGAGRPGNLGQRRRLDSRGKGLDGGPGRGGLPENHGGSGEKAAQSRDETS